MKLSKKGQRASPRTEFKPGLIPWNAGKKGVQEMSAETRKKISETMKRRGLRPQLWIKVDQCVK